MTKDKGGYPPELYTARRAEWVTMVKTLPKKQKPGCRNLFGGGLLLIVLIAILLIIIF